MAKATSKEKKQKKDIAKQIMDFYGVNYNDWLYQKHEEYINEHLMDYMSSQENDKKSKSEKDVKEVSTEEVSNE